MMLRRNELQILFSITIKEQLYSYFLNFLKIVHRDSDKLKSGLLLGISYRVDSLEKIPGPPSKALMKNKSKMLILAQKESICRGILCQSGKKKT